LLLGTAFALRVDCHLAQQVGRLCRQTVGLAEVRESDERRCDDALGQIEQLFFAADDRVTGVNYLNALNSTPNAQFAYDRYFPRLTSMIDGVAATTFSYVDPGTLGALKLLQSSGPFANSATTYT
jgi:hypothetical protein